MKHVTSIGYRRPRESGGPGQPFEPCGPWVPAFAGMTDKRLILRKSSWFGLLVYSSEAFIRGADGAPGRVPAVFAVFAGNYQRMTSRSPQKSWAFAARRSEKQRDLPLFRRCFPLFS